MPNTRVFKAASGRAWNGAANGPGSAESRFWSFEWLVGILWTVLLWTWMKPVAAMSDWTEREKVLPLFGAAAFYIMVNVLRIHVFPGAMLKVAATLLCVGWLFRESGGHSGLGLDWLQVYAGVCAADARAVAGGDWETISPENRTVIFLLGWALLAGVIQSVMLYRKRAFWLAAATWTYLVGLQLWPGLDTTKELIAAGAAGFVLLSVLHLQRIKGVYAGGLLRRKPLESSAAGGGSRSGEERASGITADRVRFIPEEISSTGGSGTVRSSGRPALFTASVLIVFILVAAALSGAGSQRGHQMEPLQADSLDRLMEWVGANIRDKAGLPDEEELGANTFAGLHPATGYGTESSRLGGQLTVSDVPAFTARTPEITYWRGETRSYYNGKGWSLPPAGSTAAGKTALAEPADAGRMIAQDILFQKTGALNVLFAGGAIEKIDLLYSQAGQPLPEHSLAYNPAAGRYALSSGWGDLGYARMLVRLPSYRPEELITLRGDYPAGTRQEELQLPDTLPDRVRKLAADTAGRVWPPYAKAYLIERYLKDHYRYSLTEVPVPGKSGDFVDSFLFGGTGAGYCDYFSTAMVVLLRAEGVPARWVKGFAPGTILSDNRDGQWTVQVSSKDAHSWVEAYIPGAGWVSFDPTPGFAGFDAAVGRDHEQLLAAIQGQAGTAAVPDAAGGGNDGAGAWNTAWSDWKSIGAAAENVLKLAGRVLSQVWSRYPMAVAGTVLALLPVLYVSRTKGHLLAFMLLLRYRRRGAARPVLMLQLLDRLWLRVFRFYGAKAPGQTLREYAEVTGARVPGIRGPLIELVQLYEHVRYADGQPPWLPRRRMAELWRRLFDKGSIGRNGGRIPM